jgi:hypothetical protein
MKNDIITLPEEDMRILLRNYYEYTALNWEFDLTEKLKTAIPYYLDNGYKNKFANIDELIDITIKHIKMNGEL